MMKHYIFGIKIGDDSTRLRCVIPSARFDNPRDAALLGAPTRRFAEICHVIADLDNACYIKNRYARRQGTPLEDMEAYAYSLSPIYHIRDLVQKYCPVTFDFR